MKRDVNMKHKQNQEALREQHPRIETDSLEENFFKTYLKISSKRIIFELYEKKKREIILAT